MKLTKALLNRMEESQRVYLTPEQRLILLYWYGHDPQHGWDEDDFALGVADVLRYYPDHRPQKSADMELLALQRKEGAAQ